VIGFNLRRSLIYRHHFTPADFERIGRSGADDSCSGDGVPRQRRRGVATYWWGLMKQTNKLTQGWK